jgi:hypothetical protein
MAPAGWVLVMVPEDGVGVTGRPVGDAVITRVRSVDVQRGLRLPRAADRKLGPAYFVLQAGVRIVREPLVHGHDAAACRPSPSRRIPRSRSGRMPPASRFSVAPAAAGSCRFLLRARLNSTRCVLPFAPGIASDIQDTPARLVVYLRSNVRPPARAARPAGRPAGPPADQWPRAIHSCR